LCKKASKVEITTQKRKTEATPYAYLVDAHAFGALEESFVHITVFSAEGRHERGVGEVEGVDERDGVRSD